MKNQQVKSKDKFDKKKLEFKQAQADLKEEDMSLQGFKNVILHQMIWSMMKESWYTVFFMQMLNQSMQQRH